MGYYIQRISIGLLVLVILFGCGAGAHRLKQAQDSYNDAARIEIQLSFEEREPTSDALEGFPHALRNYHIALSLTNEALEEHTESLTDDQLFGTALMLKALCQWRIVALEDNADQEEIRKIINHIHSRANQENITLGTRDKVLLNALPGLSEHTLGLQQSDPEKAQRLFKSAISTLEKSLSDVNPPEDHPIRSYIHLAQMRTLRAWRWVDFPNRPEELEKLSEWNNKWNMRYQNYRDKLVPLMEANRGLRNLVESMDIDFGYQSKNNE